MGQYVEEAKAHYNKTKSFRHDIKNHITVIKELLRNGKLEKAPDYIGDIEEMREELSFPCGTNNPAVDILIGSKLGLAKQWQMKPEKEDEVKTDKSVEKMPDKSQIP